MNITKRLDRAGVKSIVRQVRERSKSLFENLLNANIPVTWGYIVLLLLSVIGTTLWIRGQYRKEQRLLTAVHNNPDDFDSYNSLFDFVYPRTRHLRKTLTEISIEHPAVPEPLLMGAWLEYSIGQYNPSKVERAFDMAEAASQMTFKDPKSLGSLSKLYVYLGEPQKASEAAMQAVALAPDSPKPYYWVGQAEKLLGNYAAAESAFMTCASASLTDEFSPHICHSELITATRHLTISLESHQLRVESQATLNVSAEQAREMLLDGRLDRKSRELAWGTTTIWPYCMSCLSSSSDVAFEPHTFVVSSRNIEIPYPCLWQGNYRPGKNPVISLDMFPLAAYTTPTTVTLLAESASVYTASHPYETASGGTYVWRMDDRAGVGSSLKLSVAPSQSTHLYLFSTTNRAYNAILPLLEWASSSLLALFIFVRFRREYASVQNIASGRSLIYRLIHPASAFSWILDACLVGLSASTVLYPLWLLSASWPDVIYISGSPFYAYVLVLGLLLLRLALSSWHDVYHRDRDIIFLGAVVFSSYLVPRLVFTNYFPLHFIISFAVYYFVLVRNRHWLSRFDWLKVMEALSLSRPILVEQILHLNKLPALKEATHEQDLALATGKIQVAEYREVQQILGRIIQEKKDQMMRLKQSLGIGENDSPADVMFALGPGLSPLQNSLIAIGIGLVPYFLFLILSSISGDLWHAYEGGLTISDMYDFAFDLVSVAWGPIYLFFFGFFFHFIGGSYGVTKGFRLASLLILLNVLFSWLGWWDQIDAVEIWGDSVRILLTFVFTGAVMDWMTIQFSWRNMKLFYSSPAFASVVAVAGTVVTTVITALLTGTLSQLLSFTIRGTSSAFGLPVP